MTDASEHVDTSVTLRAVAAAAHVSLATASRALNGSRHVTRETAQRVRDAVSLLGYTPNAYVTTLMRSLRNNRRVPETGVLAWVNHYAQSASMQEPVTAAFAKGAFARAAALGFKLAPFSPGSERLSPSRLSNILHNRGIAGALVLEDATDAAGGHSLAVDHTKLAIVTVGYRHRNLPVPFSQDDQFASGLTAMSRLIALGYRRVGYLSNDWIEDRVEGRFFAGVLLALLTAGLPPPEVHLLPNENEEDGYQGTQTWIKGKRLDAVLTVFRHSRLFKRRAALWVPAGVGFATLDWSDDALWLAGIAQNHAAVGAMAVELLATRIGRSDISASGTGLGVIVEGAWRDGSSLPPRAPAKIKLAARRRTL
jgi:LacI family transcriptional regulator